MKNHFKANSQVLIKFKGVETNTTEMVLLGRIMWIKENQKDEYSYGLKFSDALVSEKEKLEKLILT